MLAACALVITGAAGGTVAWLIGQSAPVQNTFTYGAISVRVTESDTGDGDGDPNTNTYVMSPGATIVKDPVVTIEAYSERAWLLVKMDKSANFDDFMSYAMADGWTALEGVPNVFWREAAKADIAQAFPVIAGNAVTVHPTVTAEMFNALTPATSPTLTVTAYAVQYDGVSTPLDAWALVEGQGAS